MAEISELQSFLPLYDRLFGASKGESSFPLVIGRDVAYVFPAFLSQARFGKSFASPQVPGDLPSFDIDQFTVTGFVGATSVTDVEPPAGFLRYYHGAINAFHNSAAAQDLRISIIRTIAPFEQLVIAEGLAVPANQRLFVNRSIVVGDGFQILARANNVAIGDTLFLEVGRYQCRATEPLPGF